MNYTKVSGRELFPFPKLRHVLQGLALGLRDKFPYKYGRKDAYHPVKPVCECMAEILHGRTALTLPFGATH